MIRPATVADIDRLRAIERAAGAAFREIGMAAVADDEPPDPAVLARYVQGGRAWVSEHDLVLAAYLLADEVDGSGHVEQVSVDPAHAGQRLGSGLIEHTASWAVGHGFPALTLTTFVEVPWNGPYYRRCGFRFLADEELTPGLRALRAHEAEHGLDRWPRAAMRRELP